MNSRNLFSVSYSWRRNEEPSWWSPWRWDINSLSRTGHLTTFLVETFVDKEMPVCLYIQQGMALLLLTSWKVSGTPDLTFSELEICSSRFPTEAATWDIHQRKTTWGHRTTAQETSTSCLGEFWDKHWNTQEMENLPSNTTEISLFE